MAPMGRPTPELIEALRKTADRLRQGAPYRWTHQGMCNCGHLAQTVTRLSDHEIHRRAVMKNGEWADHAIDYCEGSGYPIDHVLDEMVALGLTRADIVHLERTDDPRVLRRLPPEKRQLDKRDREDVVRYLDAWAALLEDETS